jgi:pre-mRNA-splicing factor CWC22
MLNLFKIDPFFEKTEEEWNKIKYEILGEENIINLKKHPSLMQEEEEEEEE